MQHVAIDLGGTKSQICVREADGQIVQERKLETAHLGPYLERQPPSRVILETCSEAFRIADLALSYGHQVRVVPATLVRSLGVGARRIKTDRRDAQVLSEVSCRIDLPSVHIPTDLARQRRSMCTMREGLISQRTSLINCVRGWARTQLLKIRTGDMMTFPKRVREAAFSKADGLPLFVERLLLAIEALNQQIAPADTELATLAEQDPVCKRLMSLPGVGPVTSLRFVAALDDRTGFPNAHVVQAFLGLTPGENSSSARQQRTGITKAGPAPVRRALVQVAWNFRRLRPFDPISLWANRSNSAVASSSRQSPWRASWPACSSRSGAMGRPISPTTRSRFPRRLAQPRNTDSPGFTDRPEKAEQRLSRDGECVPGAPGDQHLLAPTPCARLHPVNGFPPMRHERG